VLTGVGVDVSKFFGVGAGASKRGAGMESESQKCDSAHLWRRVDLEQCCHFNLVKPKSSFFAIVWFIFCDLVDSLFL